MIYYLKPREVKLDELEVVRMRKEVLPSFYTVLTPYIFIGSIDIKKVRIVEGSLIISPPELRYEIKDSCLNVGLIRTAVINPNESEAEREGELDEIVGEYIYSLDQEEDTETGLLVGPADKHKEAVSEYADILVRMSLKTTKKEIIDLINNMDDE